MVTSDKTLVSPVALYRLGSVLLWLGVLTWLPFIVLRIAGEKPSLFWYLPFHLLGVIGGSRLRAWARKGLGGTPAKPRRMRVVGHVLIYAGILVWAPYFLLKWSAHQSVDVMDFLPYHLTGVLGGILCLGINYWRERSVSADS